MALPDTHQLGDFRLRETRITVLAQNSNACHHIFCTLVVLLPHIGRYTNPEKGLVKLNLRHTEHDKD